MVEIIKPYLDTTMNMKLIEAGTKLDVPAEREKVLVEAGVAKIIKEVKPKEETNKKKK